MVQVTAANFEEVIAADDDGIVIVVFRAEWNGPSSRMMPILEAAVDRYPDVVFGTLDVDSNQEFSAQLGVEGIPTIMAFRGGILVFNQAGRLPAAAFHQVIEAVQALDMDEVRAQITDHDKEWHGIY